MITVGYRIPGSNRGGAFTVPDTYWKKFSDEDASWIAEHLRQELGREPPWQAIRGKLIRLAKSRGEAAGPRRSISEGNSQRYYRDECAPHSIGKRGQGHQGKAKAAPVDCEITGYR